MQPKYDALRESPLFDAVILLLSIYVRQTIILPGLTESSYWSLSCLPSTNVDRSPRLVCVNIRDMETFVLGHDLGSPEKLWGLINISREEYRGKHNSLLSRIRNRNVSFSRRPYKSPGYDQQTIQFRGLRAGSNYLNDVAFCRAARRLNRFDAEGSNIVFSLPLFSTCRRCHRNTRFRLTGLSRRTSTGWRKNKTMVQANASRRRRSRYQRYRLRGPRQIQETLTSPGLVAGTYELMDLLALLRTR